jgi:hypothetical protein
MIPSVCRATFDGAPAEDSLPLRASLGQRGREFAIGADVSVVQGSTGGLSELERQLDQVVEAVHLLC